MTAATPVSPPPISAASLPPIVTAPLILPGAPRKPHGDITKATIWLYGEPKIGKTTFASKFPGVWFMATEPGQDWVETREPTVVKSWVHWLEVCAWISTNNPTTFGDGTPIRTICIDTYTLLFKFCNDQVCKEMGVSDPGEIPHGGGWGRLTKEFERVMSKVVMWPYGFILVSHGRQREFKTKGRKLDRFEPDIGAAGMRWANASADIILYAHVNEKTVFNDKGDVVGIEESRMLACHPTAMAVAGGRMSDLLPAVIPMDYDAFVSYFSTPKGLPK